MTVLTETLICFFLLHESVIFHILFGWNVNVEAKIIINLIIRKTN